MAGNVIKKVQRKAGMHGGRRALLRACARLLLPVAAAVASCLAWAQSGKIQFNLPADEFPRAMFEFYRQSHVQFIFSFSSAKDLRGIRTHEVVGEFEPRDALDRMLKGTSLTFTFDSEHSVIIKRTNLAAAPAAPAPKGSVAPPPQLAQGPPAMQNLVLRPSEPATLLPAKLEEVTVTGSLIRGVMSVSAPLITLTSQDISQASYPTIPDALYQLPINSLNAPRADLGLAGNYNWGAGINLRGLGVGATLVLVDGHRQPLSGYYGEYVDVSNIPPSMVERIEILPDGASALYGSDAVAGVVNIILRKDLEGAETQAYFGGARGGRDEEMASQLFGTHWSTGKVLVGYQFSDATPLAAAARGYAADADKTPFGGSNYRSIYNDPANFISPTTSQPLPSSVRQNQFAQDELFPQMVQHSLYGAASQDVGENVELFADGRISLRHTLSLGLPYGEMFVVPSTNPFYVKPPGASSTSLVAYSFLSELGPAAFGSETGDYDASLGANVQLGAGWRARLSESGGLETMHTSTYNVPDPLTLTSDLAASDPKNAFNPFGATSPGILTILNRPLPGRAASDIETTSVVADGPLVAAPGGPLKLAVGAERRQESLEHEVPGSANPDSTVTLQRYSRSTDAVFTQLSVPLVGDPGRPSSPPRIELTLAGRYERYSDFGSTVNPTTRLVWLASRWLRLRGSWGTSFQAPTLDELYDSAQNAVGLVLLRDPKSTNSTGQSLALIQEGDNSQLKPETASTASAGLDLTPEILPGSSLSVTYYAISYRNQIAQPAAADPQDVLVDAAEWSSVITRNPSADKIRSVCTQSNTFVWSQSACAASSPAALINLRLANLSSTRMSGLDLDAHQKLDTQVGRLDLGLSAAYIFYFDQAAISASAPQDLLNTVGNPLALRLRGTLAWSEYGTSQPGFGLNLAFNYTGGYRNPQNTVILNVAPYRTFDLQLHYRTADERWWSHTELMLDAANIFNQSPPFVDNEFGYDTANAQPLGRVLGISVKKAW